MAVPIFSKEANSKDIKQTSHILIQIYLIILHFYILKDALYNASFLVVIIVANFITVMVVN